MLTSLAQPQVVIAIVIAVVIGGGLYGGNLIRLRLSANRDSETRDSDQARYDQAKVDLPELIFGALLCFLICVSAVAIGDHTAVSQKIDGYHQFVNGSITATPLTEIPCSEDGPCRHTYPCDPYEVAHEHDITDAKGNVTGHYTTYSTEYRDCPYATEEFSYMLTITYGKWRQDTHTVASHIFSTNPVEWRDGHGIPDGVERGAPKLWTIAKERIQAHDPLWATGKSEYTNYILGADTSLLKQYSPDIAQYKKLNLLPPHTSDWNHDPLHGGWTAQKVQAVGGARVNVTTWNNALMRLNAALGITLQGDMHMVVVPASKITNSESYVNALIAYWQSSEFGKWSLAKNTIALVVGVSDNGRRVEWVREKTGMPVGNGTMQQALQDIHNVPFRPESFLGHPKMATGGIAPTYTSGGGLVENIVVFDKTTHFLRACMDCKDKGDHGTAFTYLKSDVSVPHSVKVWEFIISLLGILTVWASLYAFPVFTGLLGLIRGVSDNSSSYPYNPSNRFRRFGDFS